MAKSNKVKRAHVVETFTAEQLQEIDRCMYGYYDPSLKRRLSGPVYFARNYVRIQHPRLGDLPFEMFPYQERMIDMYLNNNKVVVLASRQVGKEQPHYSKIATPSGWTTMGDIKPGDTVLTPDGSSATVLMKHPQGKKKVYRITFDDGSFADCGIDHLWKCYIRNKIVKKSYGWGKEVQEQVISTREMIEHFERNQQRSKSYSNNYNIRIPVVEAVHFDEQKLPLDPYVLGALLGDGCLSAKGNSITFTSADVQIINRVNESLQHINCEAQLGQYPTANNIDYRINRIDRQGPNQLNVIIKQLELFGLTSERKFIPEIYLRSSIKQRTDLLQGLMDTDGTVSKRGKNSHVISYTTTSPLLKRDVQQLVWSLGGRCSIYERRPQDPKHMLAYDLIISLPCPKDCFYVNRKKDVCKNIRGDNTNILPLRRTITNIQEIGEEESSCITIDHPDRLYITDNYTVTHNTVVASAFLLWYAIFVPNKTILIAANKNDNAMEIIGRIQYAYEYLPMWIKPGVKDDGWNKHECKFDNDSRIVSTATSETSGRGMSISLLYLDEFAFVKPSVQEEFWTSILPTLSTGGAAIITSTPNGAVDKFSSIWRAANMDNSTDGLTFKPFQVAWDEPPGRDETFKRNMIALLGETKWRQEYECASSDTVVTIMKEDGNIMNITLQELYDLL